ncbi:hypothetical protein D3C87_1242440 [compost metagenome]
MLPFAATAGTKMLTKGVSPQFRSLMEVFYYRFGKVFLLLQHPYIGNITRHRFFYKHNQFIGPAYTFTFFGNINNSQIGDDGYRCGFSISTHYGAKISFFFRHTNLHQAAKGL